MSGFTGFQRDHFDYFPLHDDDDACRWVHGQMRDFAARVQIELHKIDPFYATIRVGKPTPSADHCWAAFGSET